MGLWSNWYSKYAGQETRLTSAEFVLKKIDEASNASINATLTDAAESSTLPATTSTLITTLLQTIRNNLKWLFNNKADTSHTHSTVSKTAAGFTPQLPNETATTKYLRQDGTWVTPPDNNTVYTHPTTAGNKHIPSGGSSEQILKWSSAGTAAWDNVGNLSTISALLNSLRSKSGATFTCISCSSQCTSCGGACSSNGCVNGCTGCVGCGGCNGSSWRSCECSGCQGCESCSGGCYSSCSTACGGSCSSTCKSIAS